MGYSLRYFIPDSIGRKKGGKDEEKGDVKKAKNKPRDKGEKKEKDSPEKVSQKASLFIFMVTLGEIAASQLATIGFSYVGSGISSSP